MADWKADKDRGPWPFVPQPNKWGYLNNPCWQIQSRPFVRGGPDDYDGREGEEPQIWSADRLKIIQTDPQPTHNLCGHWHKGVVPIILGDDIYIIHGAPTVAQADERDYCYKRANDATLSFITRYGGYGTGLDQLKCPYGITVDDTYVYISDVNNGRVMVRLKSNLTYVNHVLINYLRLHCVHTDGVQLWSGGAYGIDELNISTLATIRSSLTTPPPAKLGYVADITCDADYLYVCTPDTYRITVLNKADMSYVGEYGTHKLYALSPNGLWVNATGTYAFLGDWAANKVRKIDLSDWSELASIGHLNYGDDAYYIRQPMGIDVDGGKVYIALPSLGKIQIRDEADLSLLANIVAENYSAFDIEIVGGDIYSAEWDFVCRYDGISHALVAHIETMDKAVSCTSDGSNLFVVDAGANSIHKMSLVDLSVIDSFDDPTYTYIGDPTYCAVDDTYVYVSDQGNEVIHRINKSTMAYVDSFGFGSLLNPQQISISGGVLYVANADTVSARAIVAFNLTTLAVVTSAPEDSLDPNKILTAPVGITCDEDYIYIANRVSLVGVGGGEVSDLVILKRSDLSFVSRTALNRTRVEHIACDARYLFIAFWDVDEGESYVMRYNKTTLAEDVMQSDYKQYVLSVDTWYPWYK